MALFAFWKTSFAGDLQENVPSEGWTYCLKRKFRQKEGRGEPASSGDLTQLVSELGLQPGLAFRPHDNSERCRHSCSHFAEEET